MKSFEYKQVGTMNDKKAMAILLGAARATVAAFGVCPNCECEFDAEHDRDCALGLAMTYAAEQTENTTLENTCRIVNNSVRTRGKI